MTTEFEEFCEDIEKFTALIEQKRSLKTKPRTGSLIKRILLWLRDSALVFKVSWTQADSWIALPKAVVFFLALTPFAIGTFNMTMKFFHIPFSVPLVYGAFITFTLVAIVATFGIAAHRNLGLRKGQNALTVKQNAGWFMAWKIWKTLKGFESRIEKIEGELNENSGNNSSKKQ